jgi:glycopeptide antibiotics resistance protein
MINSLNYLFTDFYCLPIVDILIFLSVPTWFFLRLRCHFGHQLLWKVAVFVVTIAWISVITYSTVTGRNNNLGPILKLAPLHSYREVLNGGNREILRSNFMNAVLFYPAGLLLASLLPEKWHAGRRLLIVLLLCTHLSLAVELTQYRYCLGLAQTDDVIHNAMGACLGAVVFLVIPKVIKQIRIRRGAIV